jgi:hypothetical protein
MYTQLVTFENLVLLMSRFIFSNNAEHEAGDEQATPSSLRTQMMKPSMNDELNVISGCRTTCQRTIISISTSTTLSLNKEANPPHQQTLNAKLRIINQFFSSPARGR